MRITAVEFSGTPREGFVSYVSVEFDGVFVVKNIKILKRKIDDAFLLAMPTRTKTDGTYADIAHPLTSDFRHAMEERIFGDFEKRQAQSQKERANKA